MFNSKISVQQLTHGHPNGLTGVYPVVVDSPSKKQCSNESASVNDIAVQNTFLPVSHMDDKESSNVSSCVNDLPTENTSSHVSHTDDKEFSNVSSSHMDDKESSNVPASVKDQNTSSHVSPMVNKELPESFPQSHDVQIKMDIFIIYILLLKMNIFTIHSLLHILMKMSASQNLLFLMKNVS